MRNLLFESLQEQASRLMRRIEWLNLIGNVSPMVGLFGTVFGMIKLFNAIVTAGGQPQPVHLAGGISVALVTTFWGLFIAIPALAIHSVFRSRIETLANDAVIEAENIVPEIRRSIKKQTPSIAESQRAVRVKQPISELPAKSRKAVEDSVRLQ
jgi:biopolymer transport protein ExbB